MNIQSILTRRGFISSAAAGVAGAILTPSLIQSQVQSLLQQEKPAIPQRPDPLKPEVVKEFVIAGHSKLDRTKEMLAEMPSLLNAAWDWGGGDFETALGGAGHMGNREIAEFLIGSGARMDIFASAMLGNLVIVRALITAYPALKNSRGPHGISLLMHAQKGGEQARMVAEYLQSVGLTK